MHLRLGKTTVFHDAMVTGPVRVSVQPAMSKRQINVINLH
jgi:hypothetical protein